MNVWLYCLIHYKCKHCNKLFCTWFADKNVLIVHFIFCFVFYADTWKIAYLSYGARIILTRHNFRQTKAEKMINRSVFLFYLGNTLHEQGDQQHVVHIPFQGYVRLVSTLHSFAYWSLIYPNENQYVAIMVLSIF